MNHPLVLDPFRLRMYVLDWRRLARTWARMGQGDSSERGARFRRTAQRAVHAASEVDQYLKRFPALDPPRGSLRPWRPTAATEPWVQMATRIPASLLMRVRARCAERELGVVQFVADAVREKLRRVGVRPVK